ncbi:alpha/beta-Hydrolases superfamily protein [Striga hermonthica]|uniref:Alpha/beta-Hydrolases superfamily protein n=1 Tax=Striga hermonthica TaxID=68872 RepID=A0A9N7N0T8_STRHE|nr:alpha/beta-Hydrolases superfamily protein [Striga hermonthica]
MCGSKGGPPVTSPRVRLDDGRHLAYKERGVAREIAKHKIIIAHAYADSKYFNFQISDEVLKELQICIVTFDRAGYGESDPNPGRSVKSEAFDIQELADKLQLGPKFYVMGLSIGAYAVYGCLKYIPHRLSGVALVVPLTNFWWPCFPDKLFRDALNGLLVAQRWTYRVAHYAPWLVHWWMTQSWLPSLSSLVGKPDPFSRSDLEILEQLASKAPTPGQGMETQQGLHESLHRDLMVAFGKWDFDPTDIRNPFVDGEGHVDMWVGHEDKVFPFELARYLSRQIPWIRYHEVADAGHLLIYKETNCEAIFRELVSP